MKKSIVRLAGIPLYIHWSFWLLILWIVISNVRKGTDMTHIGWSLIFVTLIFTCVVLHELGHALTARRFGIGTKSITLLPIGGMANIERIPDNPKQELWITIMGPVVNLVIAAILFPFVRLNISDSSELEKLVVVTNQTLLFNLFTANVFLFLFNLIPAFPMDGGRILRATIALFTPWEKATRIASVVGNIIAVIFIAVGIFNFNFMLSLIGLFVLFAARSELTYATTKSVLDKYKAKDVLITRFFQLNADDSIQQAVQLLLSTQSKTFVVMNGEEPIGTLSQQEIIKALSAEGSNAPVSSYMNSNLLSVESETPLKEVYDTLLQNENSLVAVKQNGRLLGIVDLENIRELISVNNK